MVGDILRRLVARTTAQHVSTEAEAATALLQFAQSTRAGCECVAYFMEALTDLNLDSTIVSIKGIGACDLISRNAMLEGLLHMENGRRLTCVWREGGRDGHRNEIFQEEGGQQGDALMPLGCRTRRTAGVGDVHTILQEAQGAFQDQGASRQTQVWDRGGSRPTGAGALTRARKSDHLER